MPGSLQTDRRAISRSEGALSARYDCDDGALVLEGSRLSSTGWPSVPSRVMGPVATWMADHAFVGGDPSYSSNTSEFFGVSSSSFCFPSSF